MYGFIIPAKGWNLLTKLLAGELLVITRVMVGSGRLADNTEPAALTGLVQPVAAGTSTVPQINKNTCSFVVEYRSDLNGGLQKGFWLNEFGVYALDPDEGEILLYYGTLGEYPQYVSEYSGGSIDIKRFPVSIVLTDEVNVEINYPAIAFMTAEDVANYIKNYISQSSVIVSETEPPKQSDGDLWLDTSDGLSDNNGENIVVISNAVVSDIEPPGNPDIWLQTQS